MHSPGHKYNELGVLMSIIFILGIIFIMIHGAKSFLEHHGIDPCAGVSFGYGVCP